MTKSVFQKLIISKLPLSGYFRDENRFQLFPAPSSFDSAPWLKADHLNILEVAVDLSEIPAQQMQRGKKEPDFIVLEKKSTIKGQEIVSLLTTLTHYDFFTYDGSQSWFIPFRNGAWESNPEYGQRDYISSALRNPRGGYNDFSLLEISEIAYDEPSEYYKRYAERLGSSPIQFPRSLNILLNKYWSLDKTLKTIFLSSCSFFNMGLKLRGELNHSLSFASFVTAIEALSEYEFKAENKNIKFKCSNCKALESSHYKCKKCGEPIWGIAEKFRQFIKKYASTDEEVRKYANEIYGKRSKILHSGKLLDVGLIESVEIERLIILVRVCIVNFLINSKSI
jgi:hypothetical protein